MEPVYGLFKVAHGKQSAYLVGLHAHTTVKITRERTNNLPLRGVGVLRLIDQYVIDLPIVLKSHPICHLAMLQQRRRAPDHVIEIDRAQGVFRFAILRRKFFTDQQCACQPVGILRARHLSHQLVRPFEQL